MLTHRQKGKLFRDYTIAFVQVLLEVRQLFDITSSSIVGNEATPFFRWLLCGLICDVTLNLFAVNYLKGTMFTVVIADSCDHVELGDQTSHIPRDPVTQHF
jgi:hypothetical protein